MRQRVNGGGRRGSVRSHGPQGGDGLLVAGDAGTRVGRQAAIVGEVVGQVGELDAAREGIGGEPGDVGGVGVGVAVGEEIEGGDNRGRVATAAQFGECIRRVLDEVVQDSDDACGRSLDAEHDAEGVEDKGLTAGSGVELAAVGLRGEGDGVFERGSERDSGHSLKHTPRRRAGAPARPARAPGGPSCNLLPAAHEAPGRLPGRLRAAGIARAGSHSHQAKK